MVKGYDSVNGCGFLECFWARWKILCGGWVGSGFVFMWALPAFCWGCGMRDEGG